MSDEQKRVLQNADRHCTALHRLLATFTLEIYLEADCDFFKDTI